MIRLLFVGDGDRDAAMNPPLLKVLTGSEVEPTSRAWARLNVGKGYGRRLRFAIRQARDEGLQGVVATVDRDKSSGQDRLRELKAGRATDRETAPPLPTALGCANPHAEAWLLDDPVAVREVLELDADTVIPSARKAKSPKDALTGLITQSRRADASVRQILGEIAQRLDPVHCAHKDETGFAAFAEEIREEIGPLI